VIRQYGLMCTVCSIRGSVYCSACHAQQGKLEIARACYVMYWKEFFLVICEVIKLSCSPFTRSHGARGSVVVKALYGFETR
jgi:hypothetical protein